MRAHRNRCIRNQFQLVRFPLNHPWRLENLGFLNAVREKNVGCDLDWQGYFGSALTEPVHADFEGARPRSVGIGRVWELLLRYFDGHVV